MLVNYEQLSILYLHGNAISQIREVVKLSSLSRLKSLTLHGNAIEKAKEYRLYVIHHLPQLRKLDFSAITPAERDTAQRRKGGASNSKNKQS